MHTQTGTVPCSNKPFFVTLADSQLSTVLINCQSAFGWYTEAWQEYQRLLALGQTVREGVLKVLLGVMAAEQDTKKVVELLEVMGKRRLPLDPMLARRLLQMAMEKGSDGRPVFEAVMSLYRQSEVLVERELTQLAEECLMRYANVHYFVFCCCFFILSVLNCSKRAYPCSSCDAMSSNLF